MTLHRCLMLAGLAILCAFATAHADPATDERLQRVLTSFLGENAESAAITPVTGGLTNTNYFIESHSQRYFLKLGCEHNDLLGVCMKHEWEWNSMAATHGLAPQSCFYSAQEGAMVTAFLSTSGEVVDVRDRDSLPVLCEAIRHLHNLQQHPQNQFCPFDCIEGYVLTANALGVEISDALTQQVIPYVQMLKADIQPMLRQAPCHLDLHSGNILKVGGVFKLIDWEYAAVAEPLFDLAMLAATEFLGHDEMIRLLKNYLERQPTLDEIAFMFALRFLADARRALWSYLQEKLSPTKADFVQMGQRYTEQCLKYIREQKRVAVPCYTLGTPLFP